MADLPAPQLAPTHAAALRTLAPGIALSAAVAASAVMVAPLIAPLASVPAMVIALVIGIVANPVAQRGVFVEGIAFCVRTLLRWAIALLGLRIALSDIAALGISTAAIVVVSMAVTVLTGIGLARAFGQKDAYGALAGVGTAVCGASATLATATMLPHYEGKQADVAFVIVAVNALSTVAMILYPPLCIALGLDSQSTGVMLGATIHDMAQVVGAGYPVSNAVGDNAVIVKLFRVSLLLPVVLAVGLFFSRPVTVSDAARVPFPAFALGFVALCLVNSMAPWAPGFASVYAPMKTWLLEASTWGLLIAIGALGLGTSFSAIGMMGWRHIATIAGTTVVILLPVYVGVVLVAF
jgi:uncharacterized integral membrane protein (TIGR00698 family)